MKYEIRESTFNQVKLLTFEYDLEDNICIGVIINRGNSTSKWEVIGRYSREWYADKFKLIKNPVDITVDTLNMVVTKNWEDDTRY